MAEEAYNIARVFGAPSQIETANPRAYQRWVRDQLAQQSANRGAISGIGQMRGIVTPADERVNYGPVPVQANIPGLSAPTGGLAASYVDEVARYMAQQGQRRADLDLAQRLLNDLPASGVQSAVAEQLPLAFRAADAGEGGVMPASAARILAVVPGSGGENRAAVPQSRNLSGVRALLSGDAETASFVDAFIRKQGFGNQGQWRPTSPADAAKIALRADGLADVNPGNATGEVPRRGDAPARRNPGLITAEDAYAMGARAVAAGGLEAEGPSLPVNLAETLIPAADEVQRFRRRPSIEGEPNLLSLGEKGSAELAPYSQLRLPQVDRQGRLLGNPKDYVSVYPGDVAYSREVDPDATALWDRQEDVTYGQAVAELADAAKTPVITRDGLAIAYQQGRYRLASPEETASYASEGGGKNTLHGFLRRAGSDEEVPVFKPGIKTVVDRVAYTSSGRPEVQQAEVDLFRVGSPFNRDRELIAQGLLGLDSAGRTVANAVLPGTQRTGDARTISPRVLLQALGGTDTQVLLEAAGGGERRPVSADELSGLLEQIAAQADLPGANAAAAFAINPETRQVGGVPRLYVQRPDGSQSLIVPVIPPGPQKQVLLQIANPKTVGVEGPAVISDKQWLRLQAEALPGAPSGLEDFVREMRAGGFMEGPSMLSRETVARALLNKGLSPDQVVQAMAAVGAGPTEMRNTRQATFSAMNAGVRPTWSADATDNALREAIESLEVEPLGESSTWRNPAYGAPEPPRTRSLDSALEGQSERDVDLAIAQALADEQAMREAAARAENPMGYGYAQFGDGAGGAADGEAGIPGESRYSTLQTQPEVRDDLDRRVAAVALAALETAGLKKDGTVKRDLERQADYIADVARRDASPTERKQGRGRVDLPGASTEEVLRRALALASPQVEQVRDALVGLSGAGAVQPNAAPGITGASEAAGAAGRFTGEGGGFDEWKSRPDVRNYFQQKRKEPIEGPRSQAAEIRTKYRQPVEGMRDIDYTGYAKALGMYDQPEIQEAAMKYQAERLQKMRAIQEQASAAPQQAMTNLVDNSPLNAPPPPQTSPAAQADNLLRRFVRGRAA